VRGEATGVSPSSIDFLSPSSSPLWRALVRPSVRPTDASAITLLRRRRLVVVDKAVPPALPRLPRCPFVLSWVPAASRRRRPPTAPRLS